jgi:pSer/pThr/pTyr-binding forkhead associated (FHA) protein
MNSIINERMVSYQNDLQRSYMVFKMLQEDVIAEYQIRMIQENPTEQLLPLYKKQIDNDIYFFFDITSKTTLNQLLKRTKLTKYKFLSILKSLIRSIGLSKQYLLQGGSFVLLGDYIYVDPASLELSIAYLPIESETDINQEVRNLLMDLIIYKVSFETPAEGDFVYELLSLIKSEGFSLNQLDQIISGIVLQQEQRNILVSSPKNDLVHNERDTRETDIKSKTKLNGLIFTLVQLFFAAALVLLIRYFYFQAEKPDATTLIGIMIIIIALDILFSRSIRIKYKSASVTGRTFNKTEKLNQGLTPKRPIGTNKNNRFRGIPNASSKEYAAVKGYMDPKDFETSVILEETPKLACLIGFGDNVQDKIFINKPSFVIGRIKSQSDYVSSNNAVGKIHAEIINKDGAYYMKDLNSRNGTFINGERIVSNVEHPIQCNDRIAFANSEYKFLWS